MRCVNGTVGLLSFLYGHQSLEATEMVVSPTISSDLIWN